MKHIVHRALLALLATLAIVGGCRDPRVEELQRQVDGLHQEVAELKTDQARMRGAMEERARKETQAELAKKDSANEAAKKSDDAPGIATTARGLLVELARARGARVEALKKGGEDEAAEGGLLLGPRVEELRIKKDVRLFNAQATTQCTPEPSGVIAASAKITVELRNAFDESVVGQVEWAETATGMGTEEACTVATRRALKKMEARVGAIFDRALK
jgi:hypothetical protein